VVTKGWRDAGTRGKKVFSCLMFFWRAGYG
jgi:hypothetical protein